LSHLSEDDRATIEGVILSTLSRRPSSEVDVEQGTGIERSLALGAFVLISVFSLGSGPGFLAPTMMAVALVLGLACLMRPVSSVRTTTGRRSLWEFMLITLVIAGVAYSGARLGTMVGDRGSPVWGAFTAAYALLGVAATIAPRTQRRERLVYMIFLTLHASLLAVRLATREVIIDVEVFLREGAVALLSGANPYAITFTNPYTTSASEVFYGPGVIVDGRFDFGFPYLPVPLLAAVPGHLLGDVRFTGLVGLLVVTLVVRAVSADDTGRLLSLSIFTSFTAMTLVVGAWVEPVMMAALALTILFLVRGRPIPAAVALGLFLATKQYLVVIVPLLWMFSKLAGWRALIVSLTSAAVLTVPFVWVSPSEFWRSTVELHLMQPFRSDSISLLVAAVEALGWPPPAAHGILPLIAGLGVACLVAWRAPKTPAAFALGVGVTLLATVLFSKQAYLNYYSLIAASLALGIASWPRVQRGEARARSQALPCEDAPQD
jgi:hypothetical protein